MATPFAGSEFDLFSNSGEFDHSSQEEDEDDDDVSPIVKKIEGSSLGPIMDEIPPQKKPDPEKNMMEGQSPEAFAHRVIAGEAVLLDPCKIGSIFHFLRPDG